MVNQLGINLGFSMLMPYLANHLAGGLGMAAWTVGLVLGVRTLSQQGLFLLGGTLADRLGYKPVIISGCALRAAAFGLLGVVDALPALLVASMATGLAEALFNPAVRAYVVAESGERRVEAFAVFNVFYQAGNLIGPLVGLALITFDFRVVCLVAAAVFAALTILQWRLLPARAPEDGQAQGGRGVLAGWCEVIGNRLLLLFSLAMISASVLSAQIYLALPLQAWRVLGRDSGDVGSSVLFAVSTVVTIIGQVRLTAWVVRRWSPGRSVALGLALMSGSFLPLILTAHLAYGGDAPITVRQAVLALAPALLATTLLTLGRAIAYPFEMDIIVTLARGRLVATHYGFYNTLAGISVILGNLATGVVWDLGLAWDWPALVWIALAATGAAGTGALSLLIRRGLLPAATPSRDSTLSMPTATVSHAKDDQPDDRWP